MDFSSSIVFNFCCKKGIRRFAPHLLLCPRPPSPLRDSLGNPLGSLGQLISPRLILLGVRSEATNDMLGALAPKAKGAQPPGEAPFSTIAKRKTTTKPALCLKEGTWGINRGQSRPGALGASRRSLKPRSGL